MKIEALYEKILADENLRKKYAEAMKEGKLAEFLATNGCTATGEEIKSFLDNKKELSDDELELVSGGGCGDPLDILPKISPDEIGTITPITPIGQPTTNTTDATDITKNHTSDIVCGYNEKR